jgi:uncharacterized membrane protein
MKAKFAMAVLVLILSTVLVANFASADLLEIKNTKFQVNNRFAGPDMVAVEAGETYPVEFWFTALENASDVSISTWIQGERSDRVERDFGDLIAGSKYNARLSIVIPDDIDSEEELTIYFRVESDSGNYELEKTLAGQRKPDNLEILLVDFDNEVSAGETVAVEVALRNRGRQDAEDTLVTVRIPELGVSRSAFFEDLYPEDECDDDDCDRDNSRERTIFLSIPKNAAEGLYSVEVIAESDRTESSVLKQIRISDNEVEASALASPSSRTFSVGEEAVYNLVLVNSGSEIEIFNLAPQASDALSVSLSESFVAIPAGSSETVQVYVKANREGTFNFAVEATSNGFTKSTQYSATVEGRSITSGNNVVALTIVLAIVLVVLLIVLIVLLTRRPERTEEFGESYY